MREGCVEKQGRHEIRDENSHFAPYIEYGRRKEEDRELRAVTRRGRVRRAERKSVLYVGKGNGRLASHSKDHLGLLEDGLQRCGLEEILRATRGSGEGTSWITAVMPYSCARSSIG